MPELTAEENVALPLLLGGTHRDEALREARSWFERLDLEGMERHRTGEMSGGQSQRVALARGLVAHPDVLFADEPTGSLDSLNGELVMDLLTRAAREQGSTVILVTHEPRVAAYADREVIVRDGRVTATGAGARMIRLGLRLTLGKRSRSRAARARHRGSRRPRRRSAAGRPGRRQRAARPDRPWRVARHLGADVPSTSDARRPTGCGGCSSTDQFGNQAIDRVDLAAAGPNAPVPPGIPHLPGPGEYYASPALDERSFESEPANELRDRFPGRQIGTIGAAALPSPNSLIIVIGHTARQLSQAPGAVEVGAIQRTPANCYACQNTIGSGPVLQFILAGGAVALLLPVLILIATASRLSAARREERFAAMRLVGATPRQISVVSAVEAVVAARRGRRRRLRPLLRLPAAALPRAVHRSAPRRKATSRCIGSTSCSS